jgi:hypothetical protein
MSDSESMEEVPLGFLNEDLDKEDNKIIRILEEKQPSLKQRLEQVSAFKSRVLDLLYIAMSKSSKPELVLPFMADLVYYCTAQPDNSSHVFAKRISGMIMKYFNEKQEQVFSPEVVEANAEDYSNIIVQLFNSIMKNKRARNSHSVITPLLKKLLTVKDETVEEKLKENFRKLVTFAQAKKDASYIELFITPILNQRLGFLEIFHTEMIDLLKLREEGGPKTDLHRLKALQLITKAIYRGMQNKGDEELASLVGFLKQGSKEMKKLLVSVIANHETFKVKKISILKKYLELAVTLLRAYQTLGLGKRFKGLKEGIAQVKDQLPADPILAKTLKKIDEMNMEVTEEAGAD